MFALRAQADQFILTDVSYTHSGETTVDSHYHVDPSASTPKNWKSPVDYSTGSAHVRLEVKTKPGATPTKFQICFEGTPDYACTDQSPTYTTTGTYEWTTPFANFYFGGTVDWSKGINKVALILKDTNNNKPQGDVKYVPTDLRVEVAIISPGSSFVAPMRDAGVGTSDAGTDAGTARADAGTARPIADASTGTDSGAAPALDAGIVRDAGSSGSIDAADQDTDEDAGVTSAADAGSAGGHASKDAAAEGDDEEPSKDGDGGCSVSQTSRVGSGALWLVFGACLGLVARGRRRQRSR
jgi:hypothetical protein